MIEWLDQIDRTVFIWLNGFHSDWADVAMWYISGKKFWIPFYALLVLLLWRFYRWNTLWILLGVGLTILLADQFASGLCKPFFERLRPSHQTDLEGTVHLVKEANGDYYRGGKYGFISSHAANSFGLAMYLFLFFKRYARWAWALFVWAAVVSYSRIYLGVHYPADIVVGAASGLLWGWLSYLLFIWAWNRFAGNHLLGRPT